MVALSHLMMKNKHRHFILNKPYGYLSQFITDAKRKKCLGELYPFPDKTMAIGRLDEDSEGLLILSTSGIMSERVRSSAVEKEYHAQLDGIITDEKVGELERGVEVGIEGVRYQTLPCVVKILSPPPVYPERSRRVRDDRHGPTSWISITITEGKYRQVRKMTAAAGFPTLRLIRVRIGHVELGDLKNGEVRELDESVLSEF